MVDQFAATVTSPTARILDPGCGAGRMSRYLDERGCDVEGLDLSPGMIAMAREQHRDLTFTVGSLTDLPYPDGQFDGVLLWHSIIHTPPSGQDLIFTEAARVLSSGGQVLVSSQSGMGIRDVAPAYRAFGHKIKLIRYLSTADQIVARIEAAGLRETARLVRRASGSERDDQAVVLAGKP